MGKIERTWNMLIACLDLLLEEKSLFVFPLVSGICACAVFFSFLPLWNQGFWDSAVHGGRGMLAPHAPHEGAEYVKMFLFYFCNYFVITFFNTGLLCCVGRRMRGEPWSVTDGFLDALARVHHIAGWALLSAFVGVAVRVAERRAGSLVVLFRAALAGVAFSIASFLVVPIMVAENKGPLDALAESGRLFRKTWGDQLVGNFGFGIVFIMISLPVALPVVLFFFVHGAALHYLLLGLAALYFALCLLVLSALEAIFRMALYTYVTTGKTPEGFDESDLSSASRPAARACRAFDLYDGPRL